MHIVHTIAELRQAISSAARPAFVPTMGNLHRGHLSLLEQARELGDCTVASIFVNRLQFLPSEDFDRYPRTWDADCQALASVNCDVLFAPREQDLYPEPQRFKVMADPALAAKLEGTFRPGFFDGVCTVVLKLFVAVFAGKTQGVAVFGKKDYQQLKVVEAMTKQFALPLSIVAGETARDSDGLALSSRNAYLTDAQRKQACTLYQQLLHFAERYRIQSLADQVIEGEQSQEPHERLADWVARAEQAAKESLQAQGWQVDYLSLRRCADLEPAYMMEPTHTLEPAYKLEAVDKLEATQALEPTDKAKPAHAADPARDLEYRQPPGNEHKAECGLEGQALVLLAAARLGQTRLIDNLEL